MSDDIETQLHRARIVIDNLGARLGAMTAENIELLVRIHEHEQAQLPETAPDDSGH